METHTNRNHHWDNVKGILIILTVFAHILYQIQDIAPIINNIVDVIYLFHMPVFVFVSGYFGKSERSRSLKSISTFLFLFLIFNSIMGFVYGFSSLLEPVSSYWYLLSLVVWRFTAHRISNIKFIIPILFFAALLIGFHPSIDNTLAISRTIGFFPFYMLGYKFTVNQYNKLREFVSFKRLSVTSVLLVIASLITYFSFNYLSFTDDALTLGAYADSVDFIERCIMFLVSLLAIIILLELSPRKSIPLLSMFGRNSLWIFVFHRPITLVASKFLGNMSSYVIIIASLMITLFICFVFGNNFITKHLNTFLNNGSSILLQNGETDKKLSVAKITLLMVCLGFVALSFADSSIGLLKSILQFIGLL